MDIVFVANIDCLFSNEFVYILKFSNCFFLPCLLFVQVSLHQNMEYMPNYFSHLAFAASVCSLLYWVVYVFFPKSWCLEILRRFWTRDGKCHNEWCTGTGVLFDTELRNWLFQLLDT